MSPSVGPRRAGKAAPRRMRSSNKRRPCESITLVAVDLVYAAATDREPKPAATNSIVIPAQAGIQAACFRAGVTIYIRGEEHVHA